MVTSWYGCSWVIHSFMGISCGSTHEMLKFSIHLRKIYCKYQIFSLMSPKAQYAYSQWYVIMLRQIPICICGLFYRHRNGDHVLTGAHGGSGKANCSLPFFQSLSMNRDLYIGQNDWLKRFSSG